MIARLRGALVHRDGTQGIIDVGGVGYLVNAPASALDTWGDRPDEVEAHVSTQVREDAITLFGFISWDDRSLFESLLGVSGVGPRIALACLDTMSPATLTQAIHANDVRTLSKVPGVGKKTAQRMALELRDKLPAVSFTAPAGRVHARPSAAKTSDDTFAAALQRLGYTRAEVSFARDRLKDLPEDTPLSDRLRAALRVLYER